MDAASNRSPRLAMLESVRCLECGGVYSKPRAGGTVEQNPGCPSCGYVGWLSVSLPGERAAVRLRSGAGRPQRRSARLR